MATDEQVIDALANTGAIQLTGHSQPTFDVDVAKVRAVLQPEQAALNPPGPGGQPDRFISGNITLPGILPTDPPTMVPIEILIGADGLVPGQFAQGISVELFDWWTSGVILIAAGGNGRPSGRIGVRTLDGGHAFVVGNSESLLVALGGHGGIPASPPQPDGGHGGNGIAIGTGAGNDFYVQGGDGRDGTAGTTGSSGTTGTWMIGMVPGGTGAVGGTGGNGGKAIAAGGENSFALANGGDAGTGGPGGSGGPGSVAFTKKVFGKILTWGTPAPAGKMGPGGPGGRGGDEKTFLGPHSLLDPASSAGKGAAGGPGPAGTPPGAAGGPGVATNVNIP